MNTPSESMPMRPPLAPVPHLEPPPVPPTLPSVWVLLAGLLALFTLGIEVATRMCRDTFFDPIPNWWHVAAVATVPVVLLRVFWLYLDPRSRLSRGFVHLQAFSFGVCAFYALLYLPMLPLSLFAVAFLMGLLPLAPLLAFWAEFPVRRFLRRRYEQQTPGLPAPSWLPGASLAFILLTLGLSQSVLTNWLLDQAISGNAETSARAVKKLRWFGGEVSLRRACYGLGDGRYFLWGQGRTAVEDVVKTREVYYRVHGVAFDSLPFPPGGRNSFSRPRWGQDFNTGGDQVAEKVHGLALSSSRLDGQFNAAAALAYTEWTMVFKNAGWSPAEARAQIELPPGGVVSRVTLWIEGEPREAAFGSRSQVRAAYREVAVVQRRDPILVTTSGPDRVLMQCFPVPTKGEMKIRVGITSPLVLRSDGGVTLPLPRFLETNFDDDNVQHQLWYDSDVPVSVDGKGFAKTVRRTVGERDLRQGASVRTELSVKYADVFTEDPVDPKFAIQQTLEQRAGTRPAGAVFVVDGSKLAGPFYQELAAALAGVPDGLPFQVVLAGDEVSSAWDGLRPADAASRAVAASFLAKAWARGGTDNVAALTHAWDLAAGAPGSAVVWLHGPQPFLLGDFEALAQRVERDKHPPTLLVAALASGPNRIAEKLDSFAGLRTLERHPTVSESLGQLFTQWSSPKPMAVAVRTRLPVAEVRAGARKVDKHLARIWGREEAARLQATGSAGIEAAVKLATTLQLVTPLTGAVVLETKAQYDRHNLQASERDTVPMIPEPASALLLSFGAASLLLRRRRPTC